MPSKVISTLNQLIRANLTAAEVNVASPRGFAGYTVPKLGGQRVNIWGLIWSIFFTTFADRNNCLIQISLQRGLILTPTTIFPQETDNSQCVIQFQQDSSSDFTGSWFPARPFPLDPGDSYGFYTQIVPFYAPVVNNVSILMTVFGNTEPVSESADMVL